MIDLSVVIFSYNRPQCLGRTVKDFVDRCKFPKDRTEIIINDDGSNRETLDYIVELRNDYPEITRINTGENLGMGRSFNNGIRSAKGRFVLHLQDDWSLVGDDGFVEKSITILDADSNVAMVRVGPLGNIYTPFRSDGMTPATYGTVDSIDLSKDYYLYSDNPHIKRRDFHDKFGYYREGKSCEATETDMCRRFNAQSELRIVWLGQYFKHIGRVSTMGRIWSDA